MPRGKLQTALDHQQGRNLRLEKQRKQEKSAAKKRVSKPQDGKTFTEPTEAEMLAAMNGETDEEDDDMELAAGEDIFEDEEVLAAPSDGENDEENDEDEDDDVSDSSGGGIPLSDVESLDSEDKADVIPYQRLTINNVAALQKAHRSIALPKTADFSARQVVTSAEQLDIPDVHDDLNRELAFYKQCLEAAVEGRAQLKKEAVPFTRPNDYFAEMVKTDEHMGKIKAKIVQAESDKKAAAEARKLRDLKKFGKQVQVARLQERDRTRKQTLDKINQLKRKRRDGDNGDEREDDMFDIALDDADTKRRDARPGTGPRSASKPNQKRLRKDAKFGFGGKKKYAKSGDAVSSGDMRQFSVKRMKTQASGSKRLGKSRRAKASR